jgi:formylglycine-generating enzyme required for sulfatase activity
MILSRLTYYFILLIALSQMAFAQLPTMEIVGDPQKVENEIVSRRDTNGRFCSAIQVISSLEGLAFSSYSGIVGDIDHKPGWDMVYLQPDERVLEVYATGYEPLKIILSEYGIHLKPKEIWEIIVTGDKIINEIPINIIVKPEGANITIDNEPFGVEIQFALTEGKHTLLIEKSGYQSKIENIKVDMANTYFEYTLEEVEDAALLIFTDPEDADVFIDDLSIGKSPASAFYPAGKYPIRIEKEWYITYENYIDIQAPKTTVNYTLQPDFGSLKVTSSPGNELDIYLNNKNQNEITTHTFERLSPGDYEVNCKSEYYETEIKNITIERGRTTDIELTTFENFSTLTINTDQNATVTLNDDKITNLKNIRLKPMIANIEVSLPKSDSVTKRLNLKKGKKQSIDIYLVVKTGTIQVIVKPLDAMIELSGDAGEYYTSEGLYNFKNIPIGTYQLKIAKTGYETFTETVKLSEGEKKKRNIQLEERKGPELLTDMVYVEGGTFEMGCGNWTDGCSGDEYPVHTVTVDDFYIGKYEVTQREWKEIMGSNPGRFNGDDLPVERVSWNDVQNFIQKLNKKTGLNYRLPTEAEWEYAARSGGKKEKWSGTSNASSLMGYAWYRDNSNRRTTHPVGTKNPNGLGIFDMSGNVYEWCSDWYDSDYYENSPKQNPQGPQSGSNRVLRGGSWNYYQRNLQSSSRDRHSPVFSLYHIGFRLVSTP